MYIHSVHTISCHVEVSLYLCFFLDDKNETRDKKKGKRRRLIETKNTKKKQKRKNQMESRKARSRRG